MTTRFSDLDIIDQQSIELHLISFYDQVTFETKNQWLMQYEKNDCQCYSSFYTSSSMDEDLFEATKLNLFLHGKNLFEVTKFGNVQLVSKRKYSQPIKRTVNEVINLRNTNERDEPRINHEIIKNSSIGSIH